MHQINFSGLSLKTGTGPLQRDVGSNAGDGFKQLFNNLVQQADAEPAAPTLDSGEDFLQEDGELLEGPDLQGDELDEVSDELGGEETDDLLNKDGKKDKPAPDLEDVVQKLKSAETLTDEEVDVVVKEIKTLLKDPAVAKEIRDVLQKAGVDLASLSETDLRNALEALPASAREALVQVLSTDELELTPEALPDVLSQALGELRQEFREAKEGEAPRRTGRQQTSDELARRFDRFLEKSDARVEKIDDKTAKVFERLQASQTSRAGQTPFGLTSAPVEGPAVSATLVGAEAPPLPQDAATLAAASGPAAHASQAKVAPAAGTQDPGTVAASNSSSDKASRAKALVDQQAPRSNLATHAEKSKMMQRMMAQARLHLNDGEGKFQIRLEPPNLGTMRIAIENRGGVLSAMITTDNDAARQTLQQNIGSLKSALAEQGVDVGSFDVEVDQRAQDQSFAQAREDRQRRREALERRVAALGDPRSRRTDTEDDPEIERLTDGILSLKA